MGPSWGPPGFCRPQMGPMLAPWTLLSGIGPKIGYCHACSCPCTWGMNTHTMMTRQAIQAFFKTALSYQWFEHGWFNIIPTSWWDLRAVVTGLTSPYSAMEGLHLVRKEACVMFMLWRSRGSLKSSWRQLVCVRWSSPGWCPTGFNWRHHMCRGFFLPGWQVDVSETGSVFQWHLWLWRRMRATGDQQHHWLGFTTVWSIRYTHGFVVLRFVVVISPVLSNTQDTFTHILQGCCTGAVPVK